MLFAVRPIVEDDLEMIMNWRMSPTVTAYMNTNPKLTLAGQREWFFSLKGKETVKYWVIEVDNRPAGMIYLVDIDHEHKSTSWGYYVGEKKLRSMELAISLELSLYKYVFENMGFEKVYCEVFSINEGVGRLHQPCGCKVLDIVEEEVEKEGIKYDVTHFGITRHEWEVNKTGYHYNWLEFD